MVTDARALTAPVHLGLAGHPSRITRQLYLAQEEP